MSFFQTLHDMWCTMTKRCRLSSVEIVEEQDAMIAWLKKQEDESHTAIIQKRTQHEAKMNKLEQLLIQSQIRKREASQR